MGIYSDDAVILGIRILIEEPYNSGNFFAKHEFTGPNWKQDAANHVLFYFGKAGVRFQTLHPFSTSHNLNTGEKHEPGEIWLNNSFIKPADFQVASN